MIYTQVNKLWSLDQYKDCYWINLQTRQVIDTDLGIPAHVFIDKQGYPVVIMERKYPSERGSTQGMVKLHKIVALAMIHNGPYTLIEHLDDDPGNHDPHNLKFSDKRSNYYSMINNGITNKIEATFEVTMGDNTVYTGTMKEIAKESGIPRGTLYDRAYKGAPERRPRKHPILCIKELTTGNGRWKDTSDLEVDENGHKILFYDEKLSRSND